MTADAEGLAGRADLPVLGEVAYAAGHLDVAIEAWERAHAACRAGRRRGRGSKRSGSRRDAPAFRYRPDGTGARLVARAERLLEGQDETSAHAWFAAVRTYERMLTGDLDGAREWVERAIEVGCEA